MIDRSYGAALRPVLAEVGVSGAQLDGGDGWFILQPCQSAGNEISAIGVIVSKPGASRFNEHLMVTAGTPDECPPGCIYSRYADNPGGCIQVGRWRRHVKDVRRDIEVDDGM